MLHTKRLSSAFLVVGFIVMLGEAGLSKLISFETPQWFLEQFANSLLDHGPLSLTIAFWSIAAGELAIAALLIGSLVRRELSAEQKPLLTSGLILAQLLFIGLMFGLRLTHKYADASQAFFFALASAYSLHWLKRDVSGA